MAVDISVSRCSIMLMDSEMSTLFLVQVTVVAGPPEDTQVRVLDAKLYSIGEVIVGIPMTDLYK